MYICLCMGFKGRYGVTINGADELQQIISRLHKTLRQMRGDAPEGLTNAHTNIAPSHVKVGKQWSWWSLWGVASIVLVGAFVIYSIVLNNASNEVLTSLDQILRR